MAEGEDLVAAPEGFGFAAFVAARALGVLLAWARCWAREGGWCGRVLTEDLGVAGSRAGDHSTCGLLAARGLVDTAVPVSPGGSPGRLLDFLRKRGFPS